MIKNENGFTYPITLSILIIFLFFFSIRVEQLLSERKMTQETKKILEQEYYQLISVKKIEKILQDGDSIQSTGMFNYNNGRFDFQANIPAGEIQEITFTLQLHSG
jgi:competence protein ComGG